MKPSRNRRRFLRILVPALIVGTSLAATSVADAGWVPDPVPGPTWPTRPVCAEGELSGTAAGSDGMLWLTGWYRPCADADPALVAQARIGMASYFTLRDIVSNRPGRTFESATEPTVVDGLIGPIDDRAISGLGRLEAICLVSDPQSRIACARVGVGLHGVPYANPIPVDDPVVQGRVDVVEDPTINPECAGCV